MEQRNNCNTKRQEHIPKKESGHFSMSYNLKGTFRLYLTSKIITGFYYSHLQIIHLMVNENETFQEQRLDLSRRMPVPSFKLVTNNPDFGYSAVGRVF